MGRPSKAKKWLTEDGLKKISEWATGGMTDIEIAFNMGIAYSTFREWVKNHPKFSAAIKKYKETADDNVERSLYQRAMGWEYTEETHERWFNKETGKYEMVLTKTVKRQVLPETLATIFWLKNRRPDDWRDRQEISFDNIETSVEEYD